MFCKYSCKNDTKDDKDWYKLNCTISNNMCPFQYPCDKINAWRNLDRIEERCNLFSRKESEVHMANNRYKVLYEKRGILCVEINDNTTKFISNPFNIIPTNVELINIKDEYYIRGYEPKNETENKNKKSHN